LVDSVLQRSKLLLATNLVVLLIIEKGVFENSNYNCRSAYFSLQSQSFCLCVLVLFLGSFLLYFY
jgi:hypothetical protein